VITGTLPDLCHAGAMAKYLGARDIRLFDHPRWAEPFRDEIRAHAERLAQEAGLPIEFIRRVKDVRKEKRIKQLPHHPRPHGGYCGPQAAGIRHHPHAQSAGGGMTQKF